MLKVCLLSSALRFASTRIESGVSRSMQPSRVCCSCAAVDIFLFVRRLGLTLKSGIEASTSRIRVVFWAAVGSDEEEEEDAVDGSTRNEMVEGFVVTCERTGEEVLGADEWFVDRIEDAESVLVLSI